MDEERRQKLEIQLARDPKLAAEAESLRWTTAHLRVRGAEQRAQNGASPAASVWPRLRAQMETTSPDRPIRLRPLLLGGGLATAAATVVFATSVMHSPVPMPAGVQATAITQTNPPRTNTPSSSNRFSSSNLQTAEVPTPRSDQLPVHSTQAKHDDVAQKQSPQIARVLSPTDADVHDPFVHSSLPARTNPPLSVRSSNHQDQIAARDLVPQNGIIRDSQTGVPALTPPFTLSVNEPRSSFKPLPSNHQNLDVTAGSAADQAQSANPSSLSAKPFSGVANAPALKPSPKVQSKRIAEGTTTDEPKAVQAPPKTFVPQGGGGGFGGGGRGGYNGGGFGGGLNPNPSAASAPAAPVMPDSLSGHRPTPASESDIDSLRRQRDRPGISLDQQVNLSVALAKAYQAQGETRMALDRWQQALETTVQLPAYGTDAAYHLSLQTLQEAQDASQLAALQSRLEKRRSQMPNDVALRRMLASLYDFTGDSEKAYTERMSVITMGKASSEDWYQLGQADTQRNDTAAAVGAFQQALGGGVLAPEHRETARKFVLSTSQ